MIQAKQELLQALSAALWRSWPPKPPPTAALRVPQTGNAHGDLAITAAMQLSRSLKKNPREIAQALVAALQRRTRGATLGRGARDRRPRLHQPAPDADAARQSRRRAKC
jgi:arginyl-tRNA synthetase